MTGRLLNYFGLDWQMPANWHETCSSEIRVLFDKHVALMWQLYLAEWVNPEQQKLMEYLQTENRVLKVLVVRESVAVLAIRTTWPALPTVQLCVANGSVDS
ncbi:MAG: hypothetical protein QM778_00440 [Myxococcales bacterium]